MAMMKLNIYAENKMDIAKTYEANDYDLFLGTIEDFIQIVDIDKINDKTEVAKMVAKGYTKLKPIIFDVFPGLTEEEYRSVKLSELVQTTIQIARAAVTNLGVLKEGN